MAQLFAAIEMEITEQKLHHRQSQRRNTTLLHLHPKTCIGKIIESSGELNLLGYSFTVHLPTEYKSYKFSDPFGAENQY